MTQENVHPELKDALKRLADVKEAHRVRVERNVELDALLAEREVEISRFVSGYLTKAFINRVAQDVFRNLRFLSNYFREDTFGPAEILKEPPRTIDDELKRQFTRDGAIPFHDEYVNDTYPGNHPLIYSAEEVEFYRSMIKTGKYYIYGGLDHFLFRAFEKYSVEGKSVLITGSITPWYETICLEYGARPVTVDYNPIISLVPEIETMTVEEYDGRAFDRAISISSFEHDGLGGYGDPLNPDGDLEAMRDLRDKMSKGGLLFFNVPCGPDGIFFNRKRVYGEVRLPMLLDGWEIVETFGYREEMLHDAAMNGNPLFVLRNA